jgi:hypothetical protein
MSEKKPRKTRLPKAETVTLARDKAGETVVRCRFCEQEMPLTKMWTHVCPKAVTGNHLEEP